MVGYNEAKIEILSLLASSSPASIREIASELDKTEGSASQCLLSYWRWGLVRR